MLPGTPGDDFRKNKPEPELVTLGWDLDRAALENYTTIKCIKFYNQQFQIVHSKLIYSTQIKGSDFGLWNQPPAFCLLYNAIWLPKKHGASFPSCTCLASRIPAAHLRQTAMLGLRSTDSTREKQGEGEGREGCWWDLGQKRSWDLDSPGHRHLHQGKIPFTISQLIWEPRARLVLCEKKLQGEQLFQTDKRAWIPCRT